VGGRAKRPVRESDIMNKHRRNPELSYKYSVVPEAKSPNRNGIPPEFATKQQSPMARARWWLWPDELDRYHVARSEFVHEPMVSNEVCSVV
jgi:hypothetical protein